MIIQAARLAASQIFAPKFRPIMWKSLGLTLLLAIACWLLLNSAITVFVAPILGEWPWVLTAIVWIMGVGLLIGAGFLLAPVTAIFAGLFLDDVAEHVEENAYPQDEPGKPVPIGEAIWLALKFTAVIIGANLFALMLVLIPGVNFAVFFLVNGYLLGREYFTFAAMRFRSEKEVRELRAANSTTIFMAGMVIAGFMAIPILNLLTPIFAATMMVHLHKSV
ncbi:MAG: sulfate transporter family protein [Rhizobiaceae bacterium]